MRKGKYAGVSLALLLALSFLLNTVTFQATAASAISFADPAFNSVWNRTDALVGGQVSRTYLWGPEPFTAGLTEEYIEAPGGKRLVQYFDKSRMEITRPDGDKNSLYYVTNGLIVREMLTGQQQVGDNKLTARPAADIGVAGDSSDLTGPTYKVLERVYKPAATNDVGVLVAGSINRMGDTSFDTGDFGNKYKVSYAFYEPSTQHNIAGPFWTFLNQTGPVLNPSGQRIEGRLFDPVYYATGLPITEAYWANVKVGGAQKDVLVQAFERRILTFTPSNPPAFQVEMGNVGRHYYQWRYNAALPPAPTPDPTMPAPLPTPKTSVPPAPQGISANIQNFAFEPATLTVKVGTKVTWTNRDDSGHTVTANDRTFASKLLARGETFEFTFTKAGTYNYFCEPHPYMMAKVIVV